MSFSRWANATRGNITYVFGEVCDANDDKAGQERGDHVHEENEDAKSSAFPHYVLSKLAVESVSAVLLLLLTR